MYDNMNNPHSESLTEHQLSDTYSKVLDFDKSDRSLLDFQFEENQNPNDSNARMFSVYNKQRIQLLKDHAVSRDNISMFQDTPTPAPE